MTSFSFQLFTPLNGESATGQSIFKISNISKFFAELTFLSVDVGRGQRGRKPRGPFYPQFGFFPHFFGGQSHIGDIWDISNAQRYLRISRMPRNILEYLEWLDISSPHRVFFGQSKKRRAAKQRLGVTSGTMDCLCKQV